jgi:hypothetical protein
VRASPKRRRSSRNCGPQLGLCSDVPPRYGIPLTVVYAAAFGAAMAADNQGHDVATLLFTLWVAAPVVGFLVGRWWVVLAVIGVLAGHAIGWDRGENDGNPAFWPPFILAQIVFIGSPLGLGALASAMWRTKNREAT